MVCSSFDRPNLYLSASFKSSDIFADFRKFMVKSDDQKHWKFDGPTIIYCPTKKITEDIYGVLKGIIILPLIYNSTQKPSIAVNRISLQIVFKDVTITMLEETRTIAPLFMKISSKISF